ncbi:LytTR family DNA-binding domain-containing protein [Metallumcola ferriviriculae]|uniref:Stage 0 sporulation protein A homolog n=1 Tax=Metallumcola ferriviriculae TaxID=3039180 RepID=A0AAU0UJF5_9FIRM|nr:LytTR family DNA-binding domain-containing protein [Desulfitibacteraceae bacterium MK1]
MEKLKVLIVDDEYPARKELRFHLEKCENLQIVGEATNVREATELIKALDYTILFLDVNMPGSSGLDLGKTLQEQENSPFIIFVTAHEEFALDAFKVDAVDYILKPIDSQRLDKALKKVIQQVRISTVKSENKPQEKKLLGLIPVEHKGKTILIEEEKIFFIYACNDYTYIKTDKEKYLTRFTLKELEQRLNSHIFYRCHRSYLVNIKQAREVIPLYNGTLVLTVDDEQRSEVPVSRSQAKKIRQLLGL